MHHFSEYIRVTFEVCIKKNKPRKFLNIQDSTKTSVPKKTLNFFKERSDSCGKYE